RLCARVRAALRRRFRRAARHPRRRPRRAAQPEFSMPLTALRRLSLPALIAGLAAGIVASLLQQFFLVPLIVRAEALETAAQAGVEAGVDIERAAYSLLFTCVGACAFALLLTGCWTLQGGVKERRGMWWGLAGFAVFSLAPALGLPPELPGTHAADLA